MAEPLQLPEGDHLMKHGGYQAEIRYSEETGRLHGHVVNIEARDLVLFEGASVDELRSDFAGAIADYEASLREAGRTPAPAR